MARKKILVVEDEADVSKALEIRLNATGYQPVIAVDGEEGWNKAQSEKPDLIILDVILPKLDGYGLCNLIKKDAKTKNTPVIMLTAKGMLGDIEKGFHMGADCYLSKPYEWDRLLQNIKKFLEKKT